MGSISVDRIRELARSAFWLVPSLCVVMAIGLSVGLVALDHDVGSARSAFLFPGPPTGARIFLSSIIQSMITFTGLVFSITIVVLQLTSGQFSPRVLRTFLRDRTIQFSLGIFVATFVYAMCVLREVRGAGGAYDFVPRIAVTASFLLVLLSVATFIYYVAHVTNMIRLAAIVDSIGREGRRCLNRRAPCQTRAAPSELLAGTRRHTLNSTRPGVVVSVNVRAIVRMARVADCRIALIPKVGDYLPQGAPLLAIYGDAPDGIDARKLTGRVAFDRERTLEQDLAFAFRQLVDIAQRALSPGINDPTTAVQAIDVEHDLLRRLAGLPSESGCYADRDGAVRLILPVYAFAAYLDLAVGQIWPYAAQSVQVPTRIQEMLTDLATIARPEHQAPIAHWARTAQP